MAKFSEHISQAKSNLSFLQCILGNKDFWDWKVTVSFYVAVHLINSHIAQKSDLHYRSHDRVDTAINPFNSVSITKLPEKEYLAYTKLLGLSRRARYLIHEKPEDKEAEIHFTYEKHYIRALKNLDIIMDYINLQYGIIFETIKIKSDYYKSKDMIHFLPS